MDDYANNPPTFLPLLSSTNLNANQIWGTAFPNPPTMWTEGTGYWGIGKNTTGTEQSANGVTWAPDEVLLHPKGGASPARLVICWRAPRSMVVNVNYSFRKAMGCGDGVGYELRTRIGGVDTELVAFNNIGAGVTGEGSLRGRRAFGRARHRRWALIGSRRRVSGRTHGAKA